MPTTLQFNPRVQCLHPTIHHCHNMLPPLQVGSLNRTFSTQCHKWTVDNFISPSPHNSHCYETVHKIYCYNHYVVTCIKYISVCTDVAVHKHTIMCLQKELYSQTCTKDLSRPSCKLLNSLYIVLCMFKAKLLQQFAWYWQVNVYMMKIHCTLYFNNYDIFKHYLSSVIDSLIQTLKIFINIVNCSWFLQFNLFGFFF